MMIVHFLQTQNLLLSGILLLLALVAVTGAGYRIGKRYRKQADLAEKDEKTTGTITGAMLALLGFMLAVSLSMANAQFEARRKLILDEANAISTSSLRAEAIGGPRGKEIVRLLRDYTQLRLDFYAAGEDRNRLKAVYERTAAIQGSIWEQASFIARSAPTPISGLLLASLNETFDLATSRRWILEVRVPPFIIRLLIVFALLSMGMMGYYFGICGVYHPILSFFLFAAFTFAIVLTMDLDKPRSGYVKPEQSPLLWVISDLKPPPPAGPPAR